MFEVWKKTGTFFEYYAPESMEPGFMARNDFVCWAGLPPVAIFIEYVLGIKSDYSEETVTLDIRHTEAHGISRYPYGPEGTIGLKVEKRSSLDDKPAVTAITDKPFNLVVNYGDGKTLKAKMEKSGKVHFSD